MKKFELNSKRNSKNLNELDAQNIEELVEKKKLSFKEILKKTGKALVIGSITAAVIISAAFGFAGCHKTPANGIDPLPPVTTTITVQEAFDQNKANVNKFVDEIIEVASYGYKDDEVLFTAYDLSDKDKDGIDDLTLYMTTKENGNDRLFTVQNATFKKVDAQDLRDGKGELSDLVLETLQSINYDETNFEQYAGIYDETYDVVVREFQGNDFKEITPPEPVYEPTIKTTNELLTEFNTSANSFSDKIAAAIIKKYNAEDIIFCGGNFPDADENASISSMDFRLATKTGETERTISDYRVVFDPILLDDIALGKATFTNTKVALTETQTYDAKTLSAEEIEDYYDEYDSNYIDYTPEKFEDEIVTPELTVEQILTQYGDTINTNLEGHYEGVLKKQYKASYNDNKNNITNYQWDLGEVNDNNEIQHVKLTFLSENNTTATLYVYNVNFVNPLNLNDLKDHTIMSQTTASYEREYFFNYDSSIQGTRTELVNAILEKAITDGFDYQNAEVMFKENSASTDPDLGTIRRFSIVLRTESGVREVTAHITTSSDDVSLINNISKGKLKTSYTDMISFSQNLLDEYYAVERENN